MRAVGSSRHAQIACSAAVTRVRFMSSPDPYLSAFRALPDAHCHPQDDPGHMSGLLSVRAPRIAVMGTREGDWDAVVQLHDAFPGQVGG